VFPSDILSYASPYSASTIMPSGRSGCAISAGYASTIVHKYCFPYPAGNLLALQICVCSKAQPRKRDSKEHIKASRLPILFLAELLDPISHESQTMRFSSAIVLAVVAALTSSISAMPADLAGATTATTADKCPRFCFGSSACKACMYEKCVSIRNFSGLVNMTHMRGRPFFSA
jgi:hypothetical protein